MTESRPALSEDMSGRELVRWYWLQRELAAFARSVGVATGGGKQQLTARLVAHLDGGPPPTTGRRRGPAPAPLAEPLGAATLIPAGQRCNQQLRRYFTAVIGPTFRFDAAMRGFILGGTGQTLGAAVDHWHATRGRSRPEIGAQLELNIFLRDWHLDHPRASHARALEAWNAYRALPVEARDTSPSSAPSSA